MTERKQREWKGFFMIDEARLPYFYRLECYAAEADDLITREELTRIESSVFSVDGYLFNDEKERLKDLESYCAFDDADLQKRVEILYDPDVRTIGEYKQALWQEDGLKPLNEDDEILYAPRFRFPESNVVHDFDAGMSRYSFQFRMSSMRFRIPHSGSMDYILKYSDIVFFYLTCAALTYSDDRLILNQISLLEKAYMKAAIEEKWDLLPKRVHGYTNAPGNNREDYTFRHSFSSDPSITVRSNWPMSTLEKSRVEDLLSKVGPLQRGLLSGETLNLYHNTDTAKGYTGRYVSGLIFINSRSLHNLENLLHEIGHKHYRNLSTRSNERSGTLDAQDICMRDNWPLRYTHHGRDSKNPLDIYTSGSINEEIAEAEAILSHPERRFADIENYQRNYNDDQELFNKNPLLYLVVLKAVQGNEEDYRYSYTPTVFEAAHSLYEQMVNECDASLERAESILDTDLDYTVETEYKDLSGMFDDIKSKDSSYSDFSDAWNNFVTKYPNYPLTSHPNVLLALAKEAKSKKDFDSAYKYLSQVPTSALEDYQIERNFDVILENSDDPELIADWMNRMEAKMPSRVFTESDMEPFDIAKHYYKIGNKELGDYYDKLGEEMMEPLPTDMTFWLDNGTKVELKAGMRVRIFENGEIKYLDK